MIKVEECSNNVICQTKCSPWEWAFVKVVEQETSCCEKKHGTSFKTIHFPVALAPWPLYGRDSSIGGAFSQELRHGVMWRLDLEWEM